MASTTMWGKGQGGLGVGGESKVNYQKPDRTIKKKKQKPKTLTPKQFGFVLFFPVSAVVVSLFYSILRYTCCSLGNVLLLFISYHVFEYVPVIAAATFTFWVVLLDFALVCCVVKS